MVVLWIIATVLNLQGFLLDREFAIWAIVMASIAYLFIRRSDDVDESDNASYIFIISGITAIVYGLNGSTGWCIWIFVVLLVLAYWLRFDVYSVVFFIAGLICYGYWFILWMDVRMHDGQYAQTTYITTKKTLDFYKSNVINNNLFSKVDKNTLRDPAKAEAVFWQTAAEYEQKAALVCARKDSLFTDFVHKKEADFAVVDKKLKGRTDVLTIKRLWINSDVSPWTYEGWSDVELKVRGSYFLFGGTFSASLDANGEAEYVGENRFTYVNVVFNDNSFKQFVVKDDAKWLLAREGDKVKVSYVRKAIGLSYTYLSAAYQQCDEDFLYEKKYEPLLKK